MKPKIILTVASILYFVLALSSIFITGNGFNFHAYLAIAFAFCLAVLFWSVRNAPHDKTLDSVLLAALLTFFLGGILALYGQWSGNYMDSPLGYLDGAVWLAIAVWFFFVRRANKSVSAS